MTDPDGAVVPGATVTLQPSKGAAVTTTSGSDGSFVLPSVPPGVYSATATMPGFAAAVRMNVRVAQGQAVTMTVRLAISEMSTEINVTTSQNEVSVDPDSNVSSLMITGKDLDALSDDPDELTSELTALAGPAAGPNGGQIYIDGFTGGDVPPKSSIREIRINQNPFSAQYEKAGFGRIEILTKPGADKFHGYFSTQGNYSAFNTVSPFLNTGNSPGVAPILPSYYTIFSMGSLTGPMTTKSSFSINGSYRSIQEQAIISGSIISLNALDPTPCAPGQSGCGVFGYPQPYRAVPRPLTRLDISPRLDFALSDSNTLSVRYFHNSNHQAAQTVGGQTLPGAGYDLDYEEDTLQMSDTQMYGTRVVNETRFEYQRDRNSQTVEKTDPTLSVQGLFTYGGSNAGSSRTHQDHFELQNYTSISLAKNFIRLGGRLRTTREAIESNGGQNGMFTYSPITTASTSLTAAQAYMEGLPSEYDVTTINVPGAKNTLADVSLYAEDDWKPRKNLTVSFGGRYEAQSDIHSSHDIGPRASMAYGIPRKHGQPTTVLRAGAGVFFDRFDLANVITGILQNGTNQVQSIVPFTYTGTPTPPTNCEPGDTSGCGAGAQASTYTLAPNLRSEYSTQFAVGVDQQLSKTASVSVNFVSTNGDHAYVSTAEKLPSGNYQYLFQSEGEYRQQQIITTFRWNPSRRLSAFGHYTYSHADSNTNGATAFATASTDLGQDYGRAAFNQTHRLFIAGSAGLPFGIDLAPFLTAASGTPYNITTGTDVNGDSEFNDRAEFVNNRHSGNCLNADDFQSIQPGEDPNTYARIPSNYCTGPVSFAFNMRVSKRFGFGKRRDAEQRPRRDRGASQGGGVALGGLGGQTHGGGGGNGFGPRDSGQGTNTHRYNMTLGAQAFNLFNFVPYGVPVGTLGSPDFGKSQSLASTGPGSSSAAVRRIFLQASFNF